MASQLVMHTKKLNGDVYMEVFEKSLKVMNELFAKDYQFPFDFEVVIIE